MDVRREAKLEIDAARVIKAQIAELTDDEDTIRDTLEGETDLAPMIRSLVLSIIEDKALMAGAKDASQAMDVRASRFRGRIEAKRELIRVAMELAEWTSREFDVGTVALKKAAPAVSVIDEQDIPAEFFEQSEPKLDKKKLLAALKVGPVEGAALKNGAPILEIR